MDRSGYPEKQEANPRIEALPDQGGRNVAKLEMPVDTWWRHPGLIRLYSMLPILFVASTIKGYDGSLLNGLQTMEPWRQCKNPCYPVR